MINNINLIDFLKEIEEITDINGCFFINVEDNFMIESTIPFKIPKEILWELCVLRNTFQQFSDGFNHGKLNELLIEGEKGYLLLYNIPPHLILLAMGSIDINLSYVKLAMIDILKNIREKVAEVGDEILKIPAKDLGMVGETIEMESSPLLPTLETLKPVRIKTVTPSPTISTSIKKESITSETITTTPIISEASEDLNIVEMINSLKNKEGKEKHVALKKIFDTLKVEINSMTGVKFSELLNLLKDAILENFGTSLSLFDISKCIPDLSKMHQALSPDAISKYQYRIDNWASRIVKL